MHWTEYIGKELFIEDPVPTGIPLAIWIEAGYKYEGRISSVVIMKAVRLMLASESNTA